MKNLFLVMIAIGMSQSAQAQNLVGEHFTYSSVSPGNKIYAAQTVKTVITAIAHDSESGSIEWSFEASSSNGSSTYKTSIENIKDSCAFMKAKLQRCEKFE